MFPPQIDERGGVRSIVDQQDARAADRAPRPGWELQRRHPEVGGGELTGAKKAPRQGGDLDRGADGRAQHMRRLGAPPDKHEQHRIVRLRQPAAAGDSRARLGAVVLSRIGWQHDQHPDYRGGLRSPQGQDTPDRSGPDVPRPERSRCGSRSIANLSAAPGAPARRASRYAASPKTLISASASVSMRSILAPVGQPRQHRRSLGISLTVSAPSKDAVRAISTSIDKRKASTARCCTPVERCGHGQRDAEETAA